MTTRSAQVRWSFAERDPFDRMLIAQAQAENLAFVSIEQHFDDYGIVRIW